ncbi:AI-2E family transporter [Neolewinella antarctica]|uniref:PurR-regulated permease PerM n=1 Tax=Neolewinella antarctica TaxID=442734 RepID=A0ABX0XBQ7_9BACT|nr:AI-2E family transporter [Neolewinella antarctica]NJC26711.1 putative PurR-regulated permease PerM [Neolewinella antarctica]
MGADAGAGDGGKQAGGNTLDVNSSGDTTVNISESAVDVNTGQQNLPPLLEKPAPIKVTKVAAWLITISFILALIVVGKAYLVPIFMALVVWYLVNFLSEQFHRLPFFSRQIPEAVTLGLSLLFISLAIYFVGNAIVTTVQGFVEDSGKYIPKIDAQIVRVYAMIRPTTVAPTIAELELDRMFWSYSTEVLSTLTSFARGLLLVLLYVIFFLIEQGAFGKKMRALGLDLTQANRLSITLRHINSAMRTYLGVKTLTSLITAVLSWAVFMMVGVDYALFWGFLIFIFNFIPTVGSVVATFMPGFLALVQFDTLTPFLIIILGVSAIQVAVGNILEPRMMGDTLNISPLVVVMSLILWSMLWGILGMLLSVPITVAIIIICAQFPTTRNVAILLSRNGKINTVPPDLL